MRPAAHVPPARYPLQRHDGDRLESCEKVLNVAEANTPGPRLTGYILHKNWALRFCWNGERARPGRSRRRPRRRHPLCAGADHNSMCATPRFGARARRTAAGAAALPGIVM